VTAAFCRPGEHIAGFIFIGQSVIELEERPRPEITDVVSVWGGVTLERPTPKA